MINKSKVISQKSKLPALLGGKPAFKTPVPITKPTIPPIEMLINKYAEALKSGMLTNAKYVQEFEKNAAEYLGVKHAVATNSCTSGLMLLMKVLGLTGEVILPSFTFHATAHAVVWNGLKPVFVDCDVNTYNIDPKQVANAITSRTSAIIGVHIFGNPANVEALQEIAKKHRIKLIFDAAHGFGAKRKGKCVGGFGDAESFSLSPTKLLTAGEGGIVATNNKNLAQMIRVGRNYGDSGNYDCEFSGFNARMSEANALLGIESLKYLDKNVARRNQVARLYKEQLSSVPGISFQKIEEGDQSSFKDFSILIDEKHFGLSRDDLFTAMLAENIIVKKYFYPPVHLQQAFNTYLVNAQPLENTMSISLSSLSLPLYSHIDSATINGISDAVVGIQRHATRIKERIGSEIK